MPGPHRQEKRMSRPDKPTAKQLRYLQALAEAIGQSFADPKTRTQASAQIARLRAAQHGRDAHLDRYADRLERRDISRALAERSDDATRGGVEREVNGWGANATWR
jgi:hypothetical protein